MITFPKYEAYQDSGVDWLGKIPLGWSTKKVKFVLNQISEKVEMKDQPGVYIGLENIESWTGKLVETELTAEGLASCFQKDDVLFGKLRPYLAKVHLAEQGGFCTTEALVLRASKSHPKYIFYLLISQKFIETVNSSVYGSKMPRASWEFIGSQFLPIPSLKEQKRIAEFLDRKTAEIDEAIAHKQRLIELLQEQKALLINQAVTKGLNPNVPMRDSGVQWLGKMPKHWEVWRSKRLFSQRKEYAQSDDVQLSATQAYGVIPQEEYERLIGRKVTQITQHLEKRRHVEIGDFVISMRSFQGGLERAWAKGCIRSSYVVLKPSVQIDIDFFSYVFKSSAYISALQSTASFIRDGQRSELRQLLCCRSCLAID